MDMTKREREGEKERERERNFEIEKCGFDNIDTLAETSGARRTTTSNARD
jgi:hypothetical protein